MASNVILNQYILSFDLQPVLLHSPPLNFPSCFSRESLYARYPRVHFSVSQPTALGNKARDKLPHSRHEKSPSSLSPPVDFLRSPPTGRDRVACRALKHLPSSGWIFFATSIFFSHCISFLSSGSLYITNEVM